MRILGAAVGLVMFGGCYAPSFKDCELACFGTGADACPEGLTCNTGMCRLPGMSDSCSGTPIVDAAPCWPFAPSNVDPCAADFPPSLGPFAVTSTTMTTRIDTNAPSDGVPYLQGRYIVLHVARFDVAAGALLEVSGLRPLIIVSDGDVNINGTITVQPTLAVPMECAAGSPAMTGSTGAGGPGGGHGTPGGDGGGTLTLGATSGGVINGAAMLDPLRPGCPGGRGAAPVGSVGGTAGRGGGALQITTKTQIIVSGGATIVAGGSGGGGGPYTTCAGTACTGGGGGGGAGGSILLEANRVELRAQSRVCAVGGGGGNGPQTASTPPVSGGSGGDAMQCTGGSPGSIGARGGKGADVAGAPGDAGSRGTQNLDSGAGGGGGLGRIRIRAVTRLVPGTVIPAPAS